MSAATLSTVSYPSRILTAQYNILQKWRCLMQQYTLKIDGMMCKMCESHVNEQIRNAFSVKKVTSSHAKGETIILTEEELDEKKLKEIIDKTGYQLLSISKSPYEKKKGLFSFLKK